MGNEREGFLAALAANEDDAVTRMVGRREKLSLAAKAWYARSDRGDFTEEELAEAKEKFSVAGEIRVVTLTHGYAVSDDGRVFTKRPSHRSQEAIREMKPTRSGKRLGGYPAVHLRIGEKEETVNVHRLVALAFLPTPESFDMEVRHLDGNRLNNCKGNLEWGSHKENMADMTRHGTSLRGDRSPVAKLTEADVKQIRRLAAEGVRQWLIAQQFGIVQQSVSRIVCRKDWAWLTD